MKIKLNKKKIKTLSADINSIPTDITPKIGGGWDYTNDCNVTHGNTCNTPTQDIQCNMNSQRFCNPK